MSVLKQYYGASEGPLGFPMTDRAAQALDSILHALPKSDEFTYRKVVSERAPTELSSGERSDVSWISCEDPDRVSEVVLARGMNDSQFKLNPIVTLQHAYWLPPVGKSLWRKVVKDGDRRGIKAKTQYPPRPADWSEATWPPDAAFSLVQADLLRGKSIGFLPTKVHTPAARERDQPGWQKVQLVIDEWILLEYACCFLPCQQNAVVEAVSKAMPVPDDFLKAMGLDAELVRKQLLGTDLPAVIAFTPFEEVESAMQRFLNDLDLDALAQKITQTKLDQLRGHI